MVYVAAESILAGSFLPAMVAGFAIVNAIMTYSAKFLGSVRLIDMENLSTPEESFLKDAPPLAKPLTWGLATEESSHLPKEEDMTVDSPSSKR